MNATVGVREANLSDAPELCRLLALLGHQMPPGDFAATLARHLERGEHVLVAHASMNASRLLGATTVHITPVLHRPGPIGRITALVVDESARGTGVGRALVAAAEKLLTAHGCAFVEVTSNKTRTDAHAFYKRLGYIATSFRFGKALRDE